jgi:hypothetical protein
MKEIRFNDRIWFGKYRNKRISEIIKIDPKFVQGLTKEDKISLDSRTMVYFTKKSESKYSTFGRPWDRDQPIIITATQGVRPEIWPVGTGDLNLEVNENGEQIFYQPENRPIEQVVEERIERPPTSQFIITDQ